MRRMATWRPMPPWCWPRTAARSRANSPRRLQKNCVPTTSCRKVDVAGPGFINLTLKPTAWIAELRNAILAGPDYGRSDIGARQQDQRRICLRQSDRADACRPLPRRGVRRCAGQSAGVHRIRGDARILHQRCRRPGRRARALGLSALPRGARRRRLATSRMGFIRAITSSRSAPALARGIRRRAWYDKPEAEWLPVVRAKAIAMMMEMIRDDLAALNVRHDVFFSERSLVDGKRDEVAATIADLRAEGHVYEGRLPPPRALQSRTGKTASRRCSGRRISATTSTVR